MPQRRLLTVLALAMGALLLVFAAGADLLAPKNPHQFGPLQAQSGDALLADGQPWQDNTVLPAHTVPFGAFLGSDFADSAQSQMSVWLHNADLQVGHTYLPGENWSDIEGSPGLLAPWAQWRLSRPDRIFVLAVPMQAQNEDNLSDDEVASLLQQAATGANDGHFLTLARRLVALGIPDTMITLGWEMNGITYTSRCGPDPTDWKTYWRRIVHVMRNVPGQRFRFDFTPNRGPDDHPWTDCYPGDDVTDVIGMDNYDQGPGETFADYVTEQYGLLDQVRFAAAHHKPVSYPEWGMFRHGDDPTFMRDMIDWMETHDTLYQTITDYCPHGVLNCDENPQSSAVYQQMMSDQPPPLPSPSPTPSPTPTRSTGPSPTSSATPTPSAQPSPSPSPTPTATPTPTMPPTTGSTTPPAVPLPSPTCHRRRDSGPCPSPAGQPLPSPVASSPTPLPDSTHIKLPGRS
ncbi:hypothetical protein ABH940_006790 [Streptacidiphilus sp. BW17]|uniref:glycoside hydrolase family 26 protein n=1 Tax=Streptacidiphilus sp. BW17 TaxID=3156274 RepID=UPI003515C972